MKLIGVVIKPGVVGVTGDLFDPKCEIAYPQPTLPAVTYLCGEFAHTFGVATLQQRGPDAIEAVVEVTDPSSIDHDMLRNGQLAFEVGPSVLSFVQKGKERVLTKVYLNCVVMVEATKATWPSFGIIREFK